MSAPDGGLDGLSPPLRFLASHSLRLSKTPPYIPPPKHPPPSRSLVHSCSQDFYNLVDVYLDAVFHPRCISDPKVFEQEGWHYELDKPDVSNGHTMQLYQILLLEGTAEQEGRHYELHKPFVDNEASLSIRKCVVKCLSVF